MVIKKTLNAKQGVLMIEKVLNQKKDELPDGKTIRDFGGGYVECLKTKAKVVLYFGFDEKRNRVSINFQIRKEDIMLWLEAIAEKIWNIEDHDSEVVAFGLDEDVDVARTTVSNINSNGIRKPKI